MEPADEQRNRSSEMEIEARSQAPEISGQRPPPPTPTGGQPLAWIFHTPMETPTVCRVRARGLQARTSAPVGRVPSRGVRGCEISELAQACDVHPERLRAKSSVRSAIFIATTTPDAQPSSVGAAWMGVVALRQGLGGSCGTPGYKHVAPTGLGGSCGAPGYKHAAPYGA